MAPSLKKPGLLSAVTVLLTFLLSFVVPLGVLYIGGAAQVEANISKFLIYSVITAFSTGMILYFSSWKRRTDFYEKYPLWDGLKNMNIHAPERKFLGRLIPELQNPLALISIGLLVSAVFGLGISASGSFAGGVPTFVGGAEGSISPGSSLALSVEPAVFAETNLISVVLLTLFQTGIAAFLRWRGADRRSAMILGLVLAVILATAAGFGYHQFRYDTSEQSQVSVLGQFAVYNTLYAASGSIILTYMVHGTGNLFFKATQSGIWSGQTVLLVAMLMAVLGLLGTFYFVVLPFIGRVNGGGRD